MTDTQPCINEGEHVRSQRHLRAACPVAYNPDSIEPEPAEDVTERHLLVTLPYRASVDPDTIGALSGSPVGEAMESIRFAFEDEDWFADAVTVEQVYPGDVVHPQDTTEHEQLRGLLASVEATGQGDDDPLVDAMRAALTLALTRWPGVTDGIA